MSSIDIDMNNEAKIYPDKLEEVSFPILGELGQKKFNLLFAAALKGDGNEIMLLLRQGAALHALSPNAWGLAHALACGVRGEFLEALLEKGLNLNLEGPNGMVPIQLAARSSNLNVIKWFIAKGLGARDLEDLDLLHHIAEGKVNKLADEFKDAQSDEGEDVFLHQTITSKYLIEEHKLSVDTKNSDNWTPLHLAAREGNTVLMGLLINSGANFNSPGHLDKTPLHEAISGGHLEAVKLLVSLGVSLQDPDRSYDSCPMRTALENGQIHIAEYFIEQDVNPLRGSYGVDLISCAMNAMQLHVMKWYSDLGVEIKKYLRDRDSAQNPKLDVEILKWLKSIDFDLTQPLNSNTLMHIAALDGQVDVMEYLRKQGLELDEVNYQLMTPVHRAAWSGHLNVLKYLKSQEINLNQADKDGQTPIFYAIQSGNFEVINYLIENGEDLKRKDKYNNNLLHIAVRQNNISIIHWLLSKGVAVNQINDDDDTPFDEVIKSDTKNVKVLKLLEAYGARVIPEDIEEVGADILYNEGSMSDGSGVKAIRIELISWFVEHGLSEGFLEEFVISLIYECCKRGRIDKLSTLEKYMDGVPLKMRNVQDLVKYAAMHQKSSILKWLEVREIDFTATFFNLEDDTYNINCQIFAAKWIADYGVEAHISATVGERLFKYANRYDNPKAVEFIQNIKTTCGTIESPKNIDQNLLYNAVALGNIELIKKFYMKGGNLNISDQEGNTLLHHALSKKASDDNSEVIEFLIENGISLNATNNLGLSPLKLAIDFKKYNVVLLLCSLGAKIDVDDKNTLLCFLEQEQLDKVFAGDNLEQQAKAIFHIIYSYRSTVEYQDSELDKILGNKLSLIESAIETDIREIITKHNYIGLDHVSVNQSEQEVYSINLDTPKSRNVVEETGQDVMGEVEANSCCCLIS
ncbi:ankyrin repeat domain-containing protein [Candidatus Phycorickettsia trachydisci]|nr:ankyrin repeat domain-containing protein [Candidatus Phycorickettsia trachydisci]